MLAGCRLVKKEYGRIVRPKETQSMREYDNAPNG
jgi:hypothetical protein